MSKIKTQEKNIDIYNNILDYAQNKEKWFILSIILEILLEKISSESLRDFNINSKFDLSLQHMSNIFVSRTWYEYTGLLGWCFEKAVYNSILTNQYRICDYLNQIIISKQNLDFNNGSSDIHAIYWGTEKNGWIHDFTKNYTLSLIGPEDKIYIGGELKNFLEYFPLIIKRDSSTQEIWKSDLFIKQSNGNIWFGVDIKYNLKDLKIKKSGCSIGVVMYNKSHLNSPGYVYSPILNGDTFIFPYFKDFGENFCSLLNNLKIFFREQAFNDKTSLDLWKFSSDVEIMLWLAQNRGEKVIDLINYIDEFLKVNGIPVPMRQTDTFSFILLSNKLIIPQSGIIQPFNETPGTIIKLADPNELMQPLENGLIML